MATVTAKINLTSNNLTSDSLNLTVTDTLTVTGKITQKTVVTSTTATKFLEADDYTDAYVFLYNKSSTAAEIIDIRSGATSAEDFMSLGAGELAFFQWAADEDLNYDADSGTPVLEVMVFEK